MVVTLAAAVEPGDANTCLTDEQRAEFMRRVVESVAVMTLEAKHARSATRLEAETVHDNATRALAECEAQRASEMCDGARSARRAAANAVTAAKAEDQARFGREMSARAAERRKALRKEYPPCD